MSRLNPTPAFFVVLLLVLAGCQSTSDFGQVNVADSETVNRNAYIVDVIARDFTFEAPDEIPSGWVTFRMKNGGMMPHFILLNQIPDDISFEQYRQSVTPVFDKVWYGVRDGKTDQAQALTNLVAALPEWYFTSVKQMGGTGIADGSVTTETTMKLEPGSYVMECYIKTDDGIFHTTLGMIRPITVTEKESGASPPKADIELTLSNYKIAVTGRTNAGSHTVAVHFKEHPQYGLGNDVHLVRLAADTELDTVVQWMNWLNMDGLRTPAPAQFLGGTQEMPIGNTAYFTAVLEPGRYAWIAESSAHLGMVQEFLVE